MDPVVTAVIGVASAAVGALGKVAYEAVRARKTPSRPPQPAYVELKSPHVSGQMRAVSADVIRQQHDERLREQIGEVHEVVTAEDIDGYPRVHNKPSVERAILETRDCAMRTNSLLEQLIDELRERRSRLPSVGGRE